jgi:SAM-dependent methyltransferase
LPSILDAVRCPRCATAIDVRAAVISCSSCHQRYPRLGSIPILLSEPQLYLTACRRQLALLERNAALTVQVIEQEIGAADPLPLARTRLLGMIDAVQGQVGDINAILRPLFPRDSLEPVNDEALGDFLAPLTHIHYLYRDWGWPAEPGGENERALASLEAVIDGQALGRTLVLGAGGCRLAYDLHRRGHSSETLAVDIDPLLLAVAHSVIRGGTVTLREANAEIDEIEHIAKAWNLKSPDGPLGEDRFHFLLADALAPPFQAGVFDTIVTPWFIDLVPPDLRDFISTTSQALRPGGRWVSIGPLRYMSNMPVARRFTREEVFDLAERAGFRVGKWKAESMPYLVSKLSGRGKIEWVLAFVATRTL